MKVGAFEEIIPGLWARKGEKELPSIGLLDGKYCWNGFKFDSLKDAKSCYDGCLRACNIEIENDKPDENVRVIPVTVEVVSKQHATLCHEMGMIDDNSLNEALKFFEEKELEEKKYRLKERIQDYMSDDLCGGPLHIVLDDLNIGKSSIEFCLGLENMTESGREIANELLSLNILDRYEVIEGERLEADELFEYYFDEQDPDCEEVQEIRAIIREMF